MKKIKRERSFPMRFFLLTTLPLLLVITGCAARVEESENHPDKVVRSLQETIITFAHDVKQHEWEKLLDRYYLPDHAAWVKETWPNNWREGIWVPQDLFVSLSGADELGRDALWTENTAQITPYIYAGPESFPRVMIANAVLDYEPIIERMVIEPSSLLSETAMEEAPETASGLEAETIFTDADLRLIPESGYHYRAAVWSRVRAATNLESASRTLRQKTFWIGKELEDGEIRWYRLLHVR